VKIIKEVLAFSYPNITKPTKEDKKCLNLKRRICLNCNKKPSLKEV
tara:strand:+ start:2379 stop:2516 length:138 start_codon:yes stop_codon:yes gene_type:complete